MAQTKITKSARGEVMDKLIKKFKLWWAIQCLSDDEYFRRLSVIRLGNALKEQDDKSQA